MRRTVLARASVLVPMVCLLGVIMNCGDDEESGAPTITDPDGSTVGPNPDGGVTILGDGAVLLPDGNVVPADSGPKADAPIQQVDGGPPHPPVSGNTVFVDISSVSGLPAGESAIGWGFDEAIEDLDNDGKLDLVLADHLSSGNHNRILHNDGNSNFSNGIGTSVESNVGTWSLSMIDVNNDGNVDFVPNWDSQNSASFLGNGTGNFTINSSSFDHQANGAAYADWDGDGFVDLVVSNFNGSNKIWRHKSATGAGGSDFEDKSSANSMSTEHASASLYLADLNGDHFPDIVMQELTNGTIFQAATGCATKVMFNKGQTGGGAGFNAPVSAGIGNLPCYGIALGDFDNDGDLDIFGVGADGGGSASAGGSNTNVGIALMRNDGSGNFTDFTTNAGLPTSRRKVDSFPNIYDQAVFADLDQDGYLDIIVNSMGASSTDQVYRNLGNFTFSDQTSTWKLTGGGSRPQRLFVGDIDADGDVDLLQMNGDNSSAGASHFKLWRNDLSSQNWLTIRLVGSKIKTAISSKIWLFEAGHADDFNFFKGYREVMVSTSHRAPLEQNFGVDKNGHYDVVVQFWPDKTKVTIPNVAPAQRLKINENGTSAAY